MRAPPRPLGALSSLTLRTALGRPPAATSEVRYSSYGLLASPTPMTVARRGHRGMALSIQANKMHRAAKRKYQLLDPPRHQSSRQPREVVPGLTICFVCSTDLSQEC